MDLPGGARLIDDMGYRRPGQTLECMNACMGGYVDGWICRHR